MNILITLRRPLNACDWAGPAAASRFGKPCDTNRN